MSSSKNPSSRTLHGIALPGQSAPAASFDEPFEMLAACHERVERMLALLTRLIDYLHSRTADAASRQAARDVMRYFDIAAPLHHQDEELHLFPALLASEDKGQQALARQLSDEHRQMETLWRAVRTILPNVADGSVSLSDAAERVLRDFIALYQRHLQAENERAYPFAQTTLNAEAIAAMGVDMRTRRGVKTT